MSLITVEAIRGRCASFMSLPATVSEIFGGQTTPSILVVDPYRFFQTTFFGAFPKQTRLYGPNEARG